MAGYYLAFYRLDDEITGWQERTGRLAAMARADAAIAATQPELDRRLSASHDRLQRAGLFTDRPRAIAAFVTVAANSGRRHHVDVLRIEQPVAGESVPRTVAVTSLEERFEQQPLDVSLRGSYRDLIATVRELADTPIAMTIEVVAIEGNDSEVVGASGQLRAHLHVVIEHRKADLPALQYSTGRPRVPDHA